MSRLTQAWRLLRAALDLTEAVKRIIAAEQRATDGRTGRASKKSKRRTSALVVPSELDRARARRFLRGDP